MRGVLLALAATTLHAVDRSKFRTCHDTRFCRTHRAPPVAPPAYAVDPASVKLLDGRLAFEVSEGGLAPLAVAVAPHADAGVVRVRVTETQRATPRPSRRGSWEPSDVLLEPFALDGGASLSTAKTGATLTLGSGHVVEVNYAPFLLSLAPPDSPPTVIINGKGLLHYERGKVRQDLGTQTTEDAHGCEEGFAWNGNECLKIVGYWEDGLARFEDGTKEVKTYKTEDTPSDSVSETFSGHTDPVPFGPTSVGVDVGFPGASAVFGLAEHARTGASKFALKPTRGGNDAYDEPYRFYNLDVFEYDLDVPMALYGTIPLAWAQAPGRETHPTAGVFYNNPSETYVDVEKSDADWSLHFLSESGVLELFLFAPETPLEGFAQYAALTGAQELSAAVSRASAGVERPPLFALGYHQCRWNYKDEKDVFQVHGQFEELDIPYDVLWLDIEHTDGKRYFTWDSNLFPDPIPMQEKLAATGRKMVTIVDPHMKRDSGYRVHAEATEKGLYVKEDKGSGPKDFEGWCWPGSSSYLDFTEPDVRRWWAEQFALDKYIGSTDSLYTWNDMNEPSVFNGPEVTMPKTALSLAGVEHREWHNLYGMYFHRATAEGLQLRDAAKNKRPFVLSRAFYAGSQRWGAIWTGDNAARWDHLQAAGPMLLSISVCGLSFAGADAGGFFGNPDAELMTRWIQAAAYTPFFRGHAHHDARRREPWSFGEPTTQRIRGAIADRYALLPYWYTVFAEARFSGLPVLRPLWAHFPKDKYALLLDDQWMVGSALLVKPCVEQGRDSVSVYLPGGSDAVWYEAHTPEKTRRAGGENHKVPAPLDGIARRTAPALQRGGTVIARQRRLRRSTHAMRADPFELTVALDSAGAAAGDLYLDDAETFDFVDGAFRTTTFAFSSDGKLTASAAKSCPLRAKALGIVADAGSYAPSNTVERIVVLGLGSPPTAVTAGGRSLDFSWTDARVLIVRQPGLAVADEWEVAFSF